MVRVLAHNAAVTHRLGCNHEPQEREAACQPRFGQREEAIYGAIVPHERANEAHSEPRGKT